MTDGTEVVIHLMPILKGDVFIGHWHLFDHYPGSPCFGGKCAKTDYPNKHDGCRSHEFVHNALPFERCWRQVQNSYCMNGESPRIGEFR
jgi:hypothetical protein